MPTFWHANLLLTVIDPDPEAVARTLGEWFLYIFTKIYYKDSISVNLYRE